MSILEGQLGRPPRGVVAVAVACPFGFPAVIETAAYLDDGEPFPTLFYLTCPSARHQVSRKEAAGGVSALRRLVGESPETRAALEELEAEYRVRRARRALRAESAESAGVDGGAVFEAGIGGPPLGEATCLHAYAAALLAARGGWSGLSQDAPGRAAARAAVVSPSAAVWRDLLEGLGPLWCTDRRCVRFMSGAVRRAAIDVGTNSVRLLVADVLDGRPRTVVRRVRVTRLGEGLGASDGMPKNRASPSGRPVRSGGQGLAFQQLPKRFSADARSRTALAVAEYVVEARRLGAEFVTLVGTSACREAEDGPEFVASLGNRHAIAAHVISGDREARLSFLGATLDIPGDVVLLDVGGGSSELMRRPVAGAPISVSLDVGCVRATERWFTSDPPTVAEREAVRAEARDLFTPLAEIFGASGTGAADAITAGRADVAHAHTARVVGAARIPAAEKLVGVAGTVTTLACLTLGLAVYDPDLVHLATLARSRVAPEVERLAAMTAAERAELSCMQTGRADVIVAGGEILLAAMEALGWHQLTVSERDILDGIVLDEDPG